MNQLNEEKLFYERFYALHRDPMLLSIFNRFGIEVFRRSSVLEGFAAFVEKYKFRGRTCVEIGTCKGLTALVLSRYFDQVISIDIAPDNQRGTIASHCGVNNVRFVTVNNNAEKKGLVNDLQFDAAYSDGDHARDTEFDFVMLKRCGRILFHEHWPAQQAVMELVEGLKTKGRVVTEGKFALWTA